MTLLFLLILEGVTIFALVAGRRWYATRKSFALTTNRARRLAPQQNGSAPRVLPKWHTHERLTVATLSTLVTWLQINREPGLWYAVVRDLNYDLDATFDVVAWILDQPDCPNAVACLAIKQAHWPEVYGLDDPPVWNNRVLRLLQIISERDVGEGYPTDTLADPVDFHRASLTDQCAAAAQMAQDAGIVPVLRLPYRTLSARPRGPLPSTIYEVDEMAVLVWVPTR